MDKILIMVIMAHQKSDFRLANLCLSPSLCPAARSLYSPGWQITATQPPKGALSANNTLDSPNQKGYRCKLQYSIINSSPMFTLYPLHTLKVWKLHRIHWPSVWIRTKKWASAFVCSFQKSCTISQHDPERWFLITFNVRAPSKKLWRSGEHLITHVPISDLSSISARYAASRR